MEELTQDNLAELIKEHDKVIVQYGATWCGMCKVIKPKFTSMASENENVKFVYVDAEIHEKSRGLCKVENLPTFAGFVNGELVKSKMGSRETAIQEVLNEIASN